MSATLLSAIVGFVMTLVLIHLLKPIAIKLHLVDTPDHRKQHQGHIPLIGGLAIFLTLSASMLFWHDIDQSVLSYILATALLVIVGAVDDHHHLSLKIRITAEIMATNLMIFGAGLWSSDLGDLFGFGDINMPFWMAFIFTQIAVFGIINAINMFDGIDGLAGGYTLILLVSILCLNQCSTTLNTSGPILIGSLLAFILCNIDLHTWTPKVFLGDAGTMMLGFSIVWGLIESTQTNRINQDSQSPLLPVTALYLAALPLFDMVFVTLHRAKNGNSPFSADRNHLHHLLLKTGLNQYQTLFFMLVTGLVFILLGAILSAAKVPEYLQFLLYFLLYFSYSVTIKKLQQRILCINNSTPAPPVCNQKHIVS